MEAQVMSGSKAAVICGWNDGLQVTAAFLKFTWREFV